MNASHQSEHKLAVTTDWAFFGSFGLCFVLSGFNTGNLAPGLFGFTLVIFGFVAHVIINHVFDTRFSDGQVALGFGVYAVSLLIFVVRWIVVPHFSFVNITIGLCGFTALFACFVFYMVATHGVRGSIELLDVLRKL
ncbi:MAG: hypothetical protein JSW39_30205 [Desulfobacterales bacterium]|nr:MAG: hypothetical protein JSW39_30205 [Desulfobacterales bacterium]